MNLRTNRSRRMWVVAMAALAVMGAGTVRADDGSITLDGVSSNTTDNGWYIGYTTGAGLAGKNNSMTIRNGGVLTNAPASADQLVGLGQESANTGNRAVVEGNDSKWVVSANGLLQIGRNGLDNELIVRDGGVIEANGANFEANVYNAMVISREGSRNSLIVSNVGSRVITTAGGMSVGYYNNSQSNLLMITDGGVVSNAVGAGVGGGHGSANNSSYNRVIVGGGANTSRWVVVTDPLLIGCYANSVGNSVIVTNKGVIEVLQDVSGAGLFVAGGTKAGQRDNELVVTDGGQVHVARVMTVGTEPGAAYVEHDDVVGNRLTVTGEGSFVDVGLQFQLGWESRGMSNVVTVADGGRMDVNGLFRYGRLSMVWLDPAGNALIVSNGMLNVTSGVDSGDIMFTGRGNRIEVFDGGSVTNRKMALSGHLNTVTVSGTNSRLVFTEPLQSPWYNLQITSGNSNTIVVADGGSLISTGGGLYVGGIGTGDTGSAGTGNVLRVTGPGSQVITETSIYAGRNADAKDNRVEVLDGGLLEIGPLGGFKIRSNGESGLASGGGNVFTNSGGIYQFRSATPVVYTNAGGYVYINSGTISFRGVSGVNITGNVSGTDLRKMTWLGQNAFRLNNATNAATGQGYIFGPGQPNGAKNYTRLELMNGARIRAGV